MQRNVDIGVIGENIASIFLEKRGFKIIARNYRKKWGEIDIVAQKSNVYRFIEVKSVSCETGIDRVTRETIRPEDNMHRYKFSKLLKTIETYLLEKGIDSEWQLDLVTVRIDRNKREAIAEIFENIIFD